MSVYMDIGTVYSPFSYVNNSVGLELNWVLEKRGRGCALIIAIACKSLLQ